MKTHSRKAKFKNFEIILDSGIISTILMGSLTSKLKNKSSATTTQVTQAGSFTISNMSNIDFCLPKFIATKKLCGNVT